jgi:hypothetical protein
MKLAPGTKQVRKAAVSALYIEVNILSMMALISISCAPAGANAISTKEKSSAVFFMQ